MEDEKTNQNADTQTATDNKAQGNQELVKTENKNEGEKVKKPVAQKGENGEIIFKNQDELDGFIARKYAQASEKAQKGATSKKVQETQNNQDNISQEEPTETVQTDYTDKIALAMAKAGVDVQKVERAARLVDMSKVLENGVIDSKKLEDEINAVIAEFPELKVTKEEEKEEKGFKFGATQSDEKAKETTKVPTKKWNKFNQI